MNCISAFCAQERGRYAIHKLWVFSGWVYATNGHICARAPAVSWMPDSSDGTYPRADDFFGDVDFTTCTARLPAQFPSKMIDELEDCTCATLCRNRKGSGACVCDDCEDDHECGVCGGSGECGDPKCKQCGGRGTRSVKKPRHELIEVAGEHFDGKYLQLVADNLENPRYGKPTKHKLAFVADRGVQVVLGAVRVTDYDKRERVPIEDLVAECIEASVAGKGADE